MPAAPGRRFAPGELHIVLPRIEDRRGAEIPITIEATPDPKRPD